VEPAGGRGDGLAVALHDGPEAVRRVAARVGRPVDVDLDGSHAEAELVGEGEHLVGVEGAHRRRVGSRVGGVVGVGEQRLGERHVPVELRLQGEGAVQPARLVLGHGGGVHRPPVDRWAHRLLQRLDAPAPVGEEPGARLARLARARAGLGHLGGDALLRHLLHRLRGSR
jgi:hypothetical protein